MGRRYTTHTSNATVDVEVEINLADVIGELSDAELLQILKDLGRLEVMGAANADKEATEDAIRHMRSGRIADAMFAIDSVLPRPLRGLYREVERMAERRP